MAQDIVNENQQISYTNQDFSSIYPEILDLIKQLSYKWDPSISDESDPGVILVKLSALIADKCNYNIDKSILEAFPLSVTQDSNARQLYDQLGYYMDWYESASVQMSLNWIGDKITSSSDESTVSYIVPRFSIITDSETSHNYTLIGTEGTDGVIVSDLTLSTDGTTTLAIAMEGTPVKYTYQGETVITPQMVDSTTRRLYFTTSLVSQNGVFIKNTDQENYASWKRVNNIYEQSYNELRYAFGYDSNSNLAYIEFPDNYSELMGSGIEIVYLVISSAFDNIPAQQLTQFYTTVTATASASDVAKVNLDTSNVKMLNYSAATGHKDKESINDAYVNYRKTVGTFKTLITLRDYLNYIRDEEANICSNAFVCDRTNDVQTVYKIMSKQNDLDTLIVKIEQQVAKTSIESNFDYKFVKTSDTAVVTGKDYYIIYNDTLTKVTTPATNPKEAGYYELDSVEPIKEDALLPFSLKFYLLKTAVSLDSKDAYDETFNMIYNTPDIDSLLEDTAHLEHTYESILPLGADTYKKSTDKVFSDTKSYYLYNSETSQYELITDLESYDVTYTEIELTEYLPGATVNPLENEWYELVTLTTGTLTSDTYAEVGRLEDDEKAFFVQASVTKKDSPVENGWYEYNSTSTRFVETEDAAVSPGKMYYILKTYYDKKIGTPEEHTDVYEIDVEALLPHIVFFKNVYPVTLNISTYEAVNSDTQTIIMQNVINALYSETNSQEVDFGTSISLEYLMNIVENSDDRIRNVTFDSLSFTTYAVYYDEYNEEFIEVVLDDDMSHTNPTNYQSESEILNARFKKDIITKSILAGTTQLLVPDSTFTYHLSQKFVSFVNNIASITSEAIMDLGSEGSTSYAAGDDDEIYVRKTYTLKDNETLTLFRPALTTAKEFLSGARFECVLFADIYPNESYQLSRGEYIILYTPITDSTGATSGYNSFSCASGAIICPSFQIDAQLSTDNLTKFAKNKIIPYFEVNHYYYDTNTSTYKETVYYELATYNSNYMSEILNSASISANALTGDDSLSIQILNTASFEVNDKYKFFWVLNTPTYSNDGSLKTYTLFPEFDSEEESGLDKNTYTLKSGEYIYYTDVEEKNLAIYGPGTTLTRDCGVTDFTYKTIYNSLYFVNFSLLYADDDDSFQFLHTVDGAISPVLNGFYVTVNEPEPYVKTEEDTSPSARGLYEYSSEYEFYYETSDTEFDDDKNYYDKDIFIRTDHETIMPGYVYYLLLQYKNAGWYRQYVKSEAEGAETEYGYQLDSLSAPNFEVVDITSSEELINPSTSDYYEIVSNALEDYYETNEDESKSAHSRFANSLDTTIINRNILQEITEYYLWDISNLSTYYEEISPTILSNYNATSSGLNLKSPVYKDYYKKVGSTYVQIANDDIYCLDNPAVLSWYEDGVSGKQLSTDTAPEIVELKSPTAVEIFKEITPTFDMTFKNQGYYFKPNLYASQSYLFESSREHSYINASDISYNPAIYTTSPLARLYDYYGTVTTAYEEESTKWLDYIKNNWSQVYTYTTPEKWATNKFEKKGTWTSKPETYTGYYIKMEASAITSTSISFDAIYPAFTYDLNPTDRSFTNSDFIVSASYLNTMGITPSASNPIDYYEMTSEFIVLDTDLKLGRLFPNKSSAVMTFGTVMMYYLPGVFRANDFVAYTTKTYYTAKKFFTKSYGSIDSWTCSALSANDIIEKPFEAISGLWRTLQYNTSLTITESELWSFASGASIIFEAKDATNTGINWPVFANKEIVLDTDKYNIAYQRDGSEIKDIEGLSLADFTWQGYSNLLLNTSSSNGQKLYPNQSLTLYAPNEDDPIVVLSGEEDADVQFQLKYPVANVSGSFINVATTGTLGETLYNSLYAFKSLPDGDDYKYTTDVYDTYLYFNSTEDKDDATKRVPKSITLPVGVPYGDYLLPIVSKSDVTLKAEFIRTTTYSGADDEVGTIDIRLKPKALETPSGDLGYEGVKQDIYLASYVDGATEFTGDKYQYLQLSFKEYEEINLPSYITSSLDMSPSELKWYELQEDGTYELSDSEDIGSELIEAIPSEELKATDNPSENNWYEYTNNVYVLSTDTEVDPDTTYYRDKKFYMYLVRVDASLIFSITSSYEKQVTYIIRDIFRYSNNPALGDDFDAVLTKLKALDTDGDYNYVFVPNSNDLIENPIEAKAFWNTNHVYNPYTIAQLDFNNISYKFVTNKSTN